jgi:hypothetical protein
MARSGIALGMSEEKPPRMPWQRRRKSMAQAYMARKTSRNIEKKIIGGIMKIMAKMAMASRRKRNNGK